MSESDELPPRDPPLSFPRLIKDPDEDDFETEESPGAGGGFEVGSVELTSGVHADRGPTDDLHYTSIRLQHANRSPAHLDCPPKRVGRCVPIGAAVVVTAIRIPSGGD